MRRKRPENTADRGPRPGFTLVEMLVVISIIGVLIGLSGAGYFVWINRQSQDTTETIMRDVYKVLERQMKAVVDQADKETIPASVMTMAGNDPRRARVIWKKLRLKQEFPMSYYEAWYPYAANGSILLPIGDLPAKTAYTRVLPKPATAPTVPPAAANPPAAPDPSESAACLQLALSQGRGGVRLTADEMPSNALGDTNNDGLKEILDGWGKPLAFFRWPTANAELNMMNPSKSGKAALFADPLDPDGLLLTPSWYWLNGAVGTANPNRVAFESLCHPISPNNGTSSFYILPTLAAGGRDGQLGLDSPTMATNNTTTEGDNTYSFRLQLGARGAKQ